MDPFQLRNVGRSDLKLPQLGFGGAPLGDLFTKVSDADAEATIETAWHEGIRFYDTSPWYGRTQSEHRLGHVLRRWPLEELILSTKIGRIFHAPRDPIAFAEYRRTAGWVGGLNFEHHFDYSYDGVMRSYEDSIQRLGLTRIDLLVIHDLDLVNHGTKAEVERHLADLTSGGYRALAELRASGQIRTIGVGVNRVGTIPRFVELFDLDFFLVALPYTLAEQPVLDLEFPLCAQRGIGIIIGGVFASGILATGAVPGARYNYHEPTPAEAEKIRRIEAICNRHGVPLASAALQFPLHHPLVASVIPGAFHPDHVTRNIASMRRPVPAALWAELKHENLLRHDAPTP